MIEGVRQFKFLNRTGNEYDATRPEALFWEPEGLGWGRTPTVERVGDSYVTTEIQEDMPTPTGTMVFRDYQEYEAFLSFIQRGGLTFCYKPLKAWRYLDCYITVGKSEIEYSNGHLLCPVQIHATSGWYERVELYEVGESGDGDGKRYPYRYPYRYQEGAAGSIEIENGELQSYMKITIFGPCLNPFYALYKDGDRTKTGKINIDLQAGKKLVIDNRPQTMEIAEYTSAGDYVANRYANSDFTTERLFALPPGKSRIVFRQDGGGPVNAFVEVRKRV